MKRYIRSDREVLPGEFNYWYAGKPASPTSTEILGTTIGGLDVFQVFINGEDQGYFWGEAPRRSNINIFGEFALRLERDLGIHVSPYDSDAKIVSAVESIARKAVNDPRSQALFRYFGIDPSRSKWKVALARYIWIEGLCELSSSDLTHFVPTEHGTTLILESNEPVDPKIDISKYEGLSKQLIRHMKSQERLAAQEYPYNADDNVAEAIHELQSLIVKKKLGDASTLEEAEDFLISKSIENRRSPKYQSAKVANDIQILFDWAHENGLSVNKLISAARKIYRIWLAR